jgi:hypothetical protein
MATCHNYYVLVKGLRFHGGVSFDCGFLGCCAVQSSGCIPTFRRHMLPPSSPKQPRRQQCKLWFDGCNMPKVWFLNLHNSDGKDASKVI